jgi:CNT family concentrative nucleoside transporter
VKKGGTVEIAQSFTGLLVLTAIAWGISEDRKKVDGHLVGIGIVAQLVVAVILVKLPVIREFFTLVNGLALALEKATTAGTSFVFGYLGGGDLPFTEPFPGAAFILAFKALPLILVVSAISSLLYYWRITPAVVKGIAWGLTKTMGIGGATGLAAAANIFVGMVEAPLFIKPYLSKLTRAELFVVMTTGMATIAGNMMVLYAIIIGSVIPEAMGHILTASLISAPAAITVALLMVPQSGESTAGELTPAQTADSSVDAITKGTTDGVTLIINIVAMLITLVALVALVNLGLGVLPDVGGSPLTLEKILGWLMSPVAWLMGVPWSEAITAGSLLGVKTVLNEFLAYLQLASTPAEALSERSRLIMTYALCGFANFGSLGIMIGGLGTMVPDRRGEIVNLGIKSIIAGTIATCMTGAVIGVLS